MQRKSHRGGLLLLWDLDFYSHASTIFARLAYNKNKFTMSATAIVSVEDYLRRTEKPYCEYVDGVLYPKSMPTKLHALIEKILMRLLDKPGVESLAEMNVRLSPTKYLIPDVIAAPSIQDPYPTEPVLLCVEILSPKDR